MRKFQRLETPSVLSDNDNAAIWGRDWDARYRGNNAAVFHWHVVEGEKVNHLILPALKAQTQEHCSFCDSYPVAPPSIETIEHFKPKTRYPLEAYLWGNLYFCCQFCQQKGSHFDDALIQPDHVDYSFDDYFMWDFTTGEIKPNPTVTEFNQNRARVTIAAYHLNDGHPSLRKQWAFRWGKLKDTEPLDNVPYRSFVSS